MNRASSLFLATVVSGCVGLSPRAHAQTAPALPEVQELKPVASQDTVWRSVPVKNVAPSLLAWCLDPSHNTDPTRPKTSYRIQAGEPAKPPQIQGAFALPAGIQSIVPLEAQNSLLVLGTQAGMKKLEDVLAFLDKPLRQVEIEAHLVEVNAENYKDLGLDISEANPPQAGSKPAFIIGFVRGNFIGQLAKLIKQNKAMVLSAPRLTAINNQSASLATTNLEATELSLKDEKGRYQDLDKNNFGLSLGRQFKFDVTPTINNDDTVTILMNPTTTLVLTSQGSSEPLVLSNLGSLQTIANVRDGDTIGITGLNTQFLPVVAKQTSSSVVLFVTARIIRRMGDAGTETVALTR